MLVIGCKKMVMQLHIGFDDTDSLRGSCTTYLATQIISEIFDRVIFLDFPKLIRLNPNIPFKTRGNGAIALHLQGAQADLLYCKKVVLRKVQKLAELEEKNTNPGVVFIEKQIPPEIEALSKQAMWDVISLQEAEKFSTFPNIELHQFKLGRGIIGGMGALGNKLAGDFTYEHLSYRMPENFGTEREIDPESVIKADKGTPLTFNNVDYKYNSIMITPRGADPVFAGIRGETVDEVLKAWKIVEPLEKISMQMIFRTNQHTDQHFVKHFTIKDLIPHRSAIVRGKVVKKPFYIPGGHLIFSIKDETGTVDCAAYEPTKKFRGKINGLVIGDEITVYGGVRPPGKNHPLTLNIERLKVHSLMPVFKYENPFCDECQTRLKSAGKNKGYKCPKCSAVYRNKKVIKTELPRTLQIKEYLPPIIAHRHLTKPRARQGRDNTGKQMTNQKIQKILKQLVDYSREHRP
ncbi:MAG: DUF1743 domain-containing protein [Candidatus Heimdallarchaeota archaeon]|nr:DUF1743 domain-containing protein [Candidatus Heimdallarchaeota archaeon]